MDFYTHKDAILQPLTREPVEMEKVLVNIWLQPPVDFFLLSETLVMDGICQVALMALPSFMTGNSLSVYMRLISPI